MNDTAVVRVDVEDGVGIITIDNPPMNALGPGVREGIVAAVDQCNADPAVEALVLIGAGRSFIAGADIRQFGKPRPQPARRSTDVLDDSPKPIVAGTRIFYVVNLRDPDDLDADVQDWLTEAYFET